MKVPIDIIFPSPQRGEGRVRGSEAEGRASSLICRTPSPNPLPEGEGFEGLTA